MQPFTVHWSPVSGLAAQRIAADGVAVFALWPSPMNDDACFRAAGFTDFGDADDQWDANAEALLSEMLSELSEFGSPRLLSEPLEKECPWYLRPFTKREPFDLTQQIQLPMQWDNLPDCLVSFGESGVSLRSGRGHIIYWIALPQSEASCFPGLVKRIATSHPLVCTELLWDCLI
jgi:hypothetical protein